MPGYYFKSSLIFNLLILMTISLVVNSQSAWNSSNLTHSNEIEWGQLYFPDTADINCITVNTYGDIFIGTIGQNSGLYRSIDNGQSWELIFDNNIFTVFDVTTNENGVLYIGNGGPVPFLKSSDNGDNWDTINMPDYVQGWISDIYCKGVDTVFLATWENGGGLLSRTTDDGQTWDSLFYSYSGAGDHITDICISTAGEIFVSTSGFTNNSGGVFSSNDNGLTWNYRGLNNHQVDAMVINNINEIFTGDWYVMNNDETPGIYAIYSNSDSLELIEEFSSVYDMGINSEGGIFISSDWGITYSGDNGETFVNINNGIEAGFFDLEVDYFGFVYISRYSELYRTINPTVGINIVDYELNGISVYPNPSPGKISIEFIAKNTFALSYAVYDQSGKKVRQSQSAQCIEGLNIKGINLSDLKNGFYFLSVEVDGNPAVNRKILLMK